MTKTMEAEKAKDQFRQLLEEVERNQTEFVIKKRGKTIALIAPYKKEEAWARLEKTIDRIRERVAQAKLGREVVEEAIKAARAKK